MRSEPRITAPVPTLLALARSRGGRRHAFTLVEILVAVTISTIIILTAVSCFRMITNAITAANVLSTENALLRAGFQLSLQDVDFWSSHADARPPYNKGFMRVRSQVDDPATTGGGNIPENCWRRPFQPVRYIARTDTSERDPDPASLADPLRNYSLFNAADPSLAEWNLMNKPNYYKDPYNRNDYVPNPNAMLAHDPRSISRVALRPPHVPQEEAGNGVHTGVFRMGYPRLAIGDYALVSASDARDVSGAPNPRYPVDTVAPGPVYTPPNIVLANGRILVGGNEVNPSPNLVQTDAGLPPIDIPLDNGWIMYQPLLWTSLFHRLNYFGCYQYMTPGTPLQFNDAKGREPDCNTIPLPPYTYNVINNPPNGTRSTNWFTYMWDRDWCSNWGNCDLAIRMGERFIPSPSNGGWNSRALEAMPLRTCWPQVTGLFTDGNFDRFNYVYPFTVFVGTGTHQGNSMEGQAAGGNPWGINQMVERSDLSRSDPASIATTVWLPYNATDAERADPDTGTAIAPLTTDTLSATRKLDYTSKPVQSPLMSTAIMRYGRVSGAQDLTVTRVTIEDPATGRKVELSCMPFGTNFRGARQHWRLYSKGLASVAAPPVGHRFGYPDKECIGDFYDSNQGPYYVP
jgi:prepilin-type N-terminal cleavage/methylation domain-containing protein